VTPIAERVNRPGEERTQAGDHAIRGAEIGCPFSRAIEDQQLVPDEHGSGHYGTRAAGTGQSGDRHQQVHKRNGEVAHAPAVSRSRNLEKRSRICCSPSTSAVSDAETLKNCARTVAFPFRTYKVDR
jgi:hypothetical protein